MTSRARALSRVAIGATLTGTALLASSSSDPPRGLPAHSAQRVAVGDLTLRVVRAGTGTPVILLHGYGESLLSWRGLFDELARGADVIAVDLPGFGASSKPTEGYGTETMAAVVGRLLDELDLKRVVVVGHSLGGAVGAAVAVRQPERVLGLVLIDPALVTPWVLPGTVDSTAATAALRRLIAAYEGMRTRFAGAHDPLWLAEDSIARAYQPANDPAYARALERVLQDFDFQYLTPERASRLSMPVLLVWGAQDPTVPLSSGRQLQAMLPRARLAIIPLSWHRPHLERPEVVLRLLKAFLAETSAPAAPRAH